MKLAVFIPAYNEASTIEGVLAEIPRKISGIDEIAVFVVDDGSTDGTSEVAKRSFPAPTSEVTQTSEVDSAIESRPAIIRIEPNQGLANAFRVGLAASLASKADYIVHLDADGQYYPSEIPKLLEPLQKGAADLVTGDRQIEKCRFLGPARQYGNIAGSWFLRAYTGVQANDASCGFRAYTRAAAQQLEVHSTHTYTHETLIEARYKSLRVAEVPITFRHRGKTDAFRSTVHNAVPAPVAAAGADAPAHTTTSRLTAGLHRHIYKSLRAIFAAKARYSKNKPIPVNG